MLICLHIHLQCPSESEEHWETLETLWPPTQQKKLPLIKLRECDNKSQRKKNKVLVLPNLPFQKIRSVHVFSMPSFYPENLRQGPCFEYWCIAALWAAWEYSHGCIRWHIDWWCTDWCARNSTHLRIWRLKWKYCGHQIHFGVTC